MPKQHLPTHDQMMNPLIKALKELGGSGTIEEINSKVISNLGLTDEQLNVLHKSEKGGGTSEIEYRLAWTRTYLKVFGLLDNSKRGVWSLTHKGNLCEHVSEKEVVKFFRDKKENKETVDNNLIDLKEVKDWHDVLMTTLLNMNPNAFERLIQRLLRESGFVQVEVTGRSGDGGIDGNGILKLGGLLSFHVIFQCKRWNNPVGAGQIRDFRGAMVGRADKGLFITTGTYSSGASKEATRDGAPAIDLINGEQLIAKLKDLSLGVVTKILQVEEVEVDHSWFESI